MKYVLLFLVLINTHEIIGILEWTVTGKVTDYGQNVTLFCHVPNCCPKDAGWDRWTPVQQTLFIDVKTGRSNKKYDGKVMKDGYTLVIQNLTEQDLNVSYSCLYGVTLGEQKFLLEEDVFTRSTNSNSRFSVGEIAALIAGVVALVLVLIMIEVWRRRKKRKPINSIKKTDSDTEMEKLITKPSAPVGPLSISNITDSSAFIEWQAPQNDGGAEVEEYKIEYQLVDASTWIMCETVNGNTYKNCVKGLKEGRCYNFKVTARNGCGPGSSLEALLPTRLLAKPSAPSGPLSISNITDSSAFIEWQAPQNDGGALVEEYHIEYQLVDETTWKTCEIVKSMIYNYCVKDLKEGQSYNFKVTASNRCGPGSSLESLKPTKLLEIPSVEEKNRYMNALEAGKEHRQYVRIQVIGKHGVGKTTLVRKLLEDKQTGEVPSTDGIEIHQKCKIKQDGTWIICDVDSERDKIEERILNTVWEDQTQKGEQADSNERGHTFESESTQNMRGQSWYEDFESMPSQPDEMEPTISTEDFTETNDPIVTAPIIDNESKSIQNCSGASNDNLIDKELHETETERISPNTSNLRKRDKMYKTKPELMNEDLNLKMTEAIVKNMDAFLSYVKNKKDKMKSDGMVECGIWDYAGQRDYYATHQTFLTSKAIYLLVVDIKDGITTFQDDMDFSFESIGRYIDFWLDSIHFHRDIQDTTADELRPPVIMVCTGIDKAGKNRETEKEEYRKKFDTAFGKHNASNHIRGEIHFISNIDSPKKDFEELKTHISDIAKEMHFFEESLPTKWIELEHALMVLKQLKEEKMEYCETWESIVEIAKTVSIEKNELIDFLNYQHGIGNILFFENQSNYIILKPNWLVDCFRCLVCDEAKRNNCTKIELTQLACEGKITEHVVDKLFGKAFGPQFAKMKPYILSVMEKFDIIVKQELANSYYIPCMVTSSSTIENIKREHNVLDEECTPWLVFEFKFLPIAHYNHIIASYIKAYSKNGTLDLYAGKIIINLDQTNFRQLIVCFSKNAISLQIWKRTTIDDNVCRFIIEELYNEIEVVDEKVVNKLEFIIKAKCSNGHYFDKENRLSYGDLTTKCEGGKYRCKQHSTNHESKDLKETWLKHIPVIEHEMQDKKKKKEDDEKEANEKHKQGIKDNQNVHGNLTKTFTYLKISKRLGDFQNLNIDLQQRTISKKLYDQEEYTINSGIAVVINNRHFDDGLNLRNRRDVFDSSILTVLLERLGFRHEYLYDVSKDDMKKKIEQIKTDKTALQKADCLIFVLLTYGDRDIVYMKDGHITVNELMEPFQATNCEELILKPKLFIYETNDTQTVDAMTFAAGRTFRVTRGYDPNQADAAGEYVVYDERHGRDEVIWIPNEADFLVVHYHSYDNTSSNTANNSGSLTELIHGLLMYENQHIYRILTRVNAKCLYKGTKHCTMMPLFVSTLTKDLYLYNKRLRCSSYCPR